MSKVRQNRRTDGVIEVGAILVGPVLVAYGLGMASWSSSSDSSTGFIDLSYGDPPYGFKETAWAEIVARPYFHGGAWILLGVVAALAGVAVLRRSAVMSVSAVWISLIAGVWTFAAVLALKLVDLQVGAYLPTIGHVIVAGVLVSVVAGADGSVSGSWPLQSSPLLLAWWCGSCQSTPSTRRVHSLPRIATTIRGHAATPFRCWSVGSWD